MARFIIVKKRYFAYSCLVLALAFMGVMGVKFLGSSQASTIPEKVEPEVKILSIEFDPPLVVSDVTYGKEVFKGLQTITKNNFRISAVVQNMTEKTMNQIPIKMTISSIEDKTKQLIKEGEIAALEPGKTARISFENITALGDAKGQSATAGQHEMTFALKANIEGGMSQNTEAKVIFNVDTSVK